MLLGAIGGKRSPFRERFPDGLRMDWSPVALTRVQVSARSAARTAVLQTPPAIRCSSGALSTQPVGVRVQLRTRDLPLPSCNSQGTSSEAVQTWLEQCSGIGRQGQVEFDAPMPENGKRSILGLINFRGTGKIVGKLTKIFRFREQAGLGSHRNGGARRWEVRR